MRVYIVTRDRLPGLRKVLPHWAAQNLPVTLVVERAERRAHLDLMNEVGIVFEVFAPGDNMPIGAIRAATFEHARLSNHKVIILADDDCYPKDSVAPLIAFVKENRRRALGIGAIKSGYGLLIGNDTLKLTCPVLHTGSVGRQLAAWSVENVLALGNVDRALRAFEDNEVCVRGIAEKLPWYLHCGVRAQQVSKRFSPGGLMSAFGGSRERRDESIRESHRYVYAKHGPRYVSTPGGPFRFYWSKMLDDAFGPKWRRFLHNGIMPTG